MIESQKGAAHQNLYNTLNIEWDIGAAHRNTNRSLQQKRLSDIGVPRYSLKITILQ